MVLFIPSVSCPISVNGVTTQVNAGEEVSVSESAFAVYQGTGWAYELIDEEADASDEAEAASDEENAGEGEGE